MTIPKPLVSLMPFEIEAAVQTELAQIAVERGSRLTGFAHTDELGWFNLVARRPVRSDLNAYTHRLDPDVTFDWIDTPATEIMRAEVAKVAHLFDRITRVSLLLLHAGATLHLHRDPARPVDQHLRNRHLCLKAPISVVAGDNGNPVAAIDGVEYRYDVGRRYFLLNEIDMLHGARPSGHHRGVMHIDGILRFDVIDALPTDHVPSERLEGSTRSIAG